MYMMEPPTNGKVVLRTSSGDIGKHEESFYNF